MTISVNSCIHHKDGETMEISETSKEEIMKTLWKISEKFSGI